MEDDAEGGGRVEGVSLRGECWVVPGNEREFLVNVGWKRPGKRGGVSRVSDGGMRKGLGCRRVRWETRLPRSMGDRGGGSKKRKKK